MVEALMKSSPSNHDAWSRTSINLPPRSQIQQFQKTLAEYKDWLTMESQQENDTYTIQSRREYATMAMRPTYYHGNEIRTFAPIKRSLSAMNTITAGQAGFLVILIGTIILGFCFSPLSTGMILLGLITVVYFVNLAINTISLAKVITHSPESRIDEDLIHAIDDSLWPSYTILCPLYKEVEVVPQFVHAIESLDYPKEKLQVLFLTEVDDKSTREAILSMRLPTHFQVVTVPDGQPRTKPRACNYGLIQATGRYIVIFDAEDVPDPLQLKKVVLTFARHSVDTICIQAKLGFYNPYQNLLTRWFTLEYALWFNFTLPALQWAGLTLPLGGTSNHFRTSLLRRLGGWDPYNVTEDCDLGLRLAQYGFRTAVLDSTTLEEANSNFKNWIRQRSRWIKGYFQTYLVHMRRPWKFLNPRRWREFVSLQLIIGASPATFFINPLMWLSIVVYIVARPYVATTFQQLYVGPIYYLALVCLIWGNFLYFYIYFIACARTRQYPLMIAIPLIILYWMMMSIAASMAFYQLIFKPHYWEKTKHGLHLKQKSFPQPAHEEVPVQGSYPSTIPTH
jgi:cellulose synthase/poly-beta-1,6-N-acetylglucosamine synthase-like glycosyltransferase